MAFLRLIRIQNILIIALTMWAVRYFIGWDVLHDEENLNYFLFILATCLIAAGGNAINDYFDVKADRINKPNELIVTRHIKKRWVIVSHWIVSAIGLAIYSYFSWKFHTFFYLFIALFSIGLLLFYSLSFKKKLFWSNFIVAFLIGLIPLISIRFLAFKNPSENQVMIVCFYALFAFIANFCREVVKDIQDMEGDLKIGVRSFAIAWGIKKTQILISVSTLVLLVVFYIGTTTVSVPQKDVFQLFMALAISLASIVNMIFVLLKRWNLSNLTLKLSMILGTISLFFP